MIAVDTSVLVAAVAPRHESHAVARAVLPGTRLVTGLLLPPLAWLVTYLMGLWSAGAGVRLWWRRG